MTAIEPDLGYLWTEFQHAWHKHRQQLDCKDGKSRVAATRYDALEALEAYSTALETRHLPVPPKIHRDLKLLRDLCTHARGSWL